ncbi:unnamed protein product [Lathyrus sativus]|nr:unnamed protein product [Lathyrus sativus]
MHNQFLRATEPLHGDINVAIFHLVASNELVRHASTEVRKLAGKRKINYEISRYLGSLFLEHLEAYE